MDVSSLLSTFGGGAYTLLVFIVALSIIVAVHEYGHYIVGRWSGIHADVFSIGFGPVLFARTDKRGTVWQIAALPFGGYVKFAGDADAASGKDVDAMSDLDAAARRRTMHGAPLWARSATVAAGPVFNFILSILVFGAILFTQGTPRTPMTIDTLRDLPAQSAGELRSGDEVLAIEGVKTPDFSSVYAATDDLPVEGPLSYTIVRDGQEMRLDGPYPFPPLIDAIQPRSAAYDVGLQTGDVITSIDGTPITAFKELQATVFSSEGRPLLLTIWRDGAEMEIALAPRKRDVPLPDGGFETRWLIGMTGGLAFTPATDAPGVFEAAKYGVDQMLFIIENSFSGLYNIITGAISSCNLSGPLGMAQATGTAASQGTSSFIWWIAVLSTAVGLLNLFPIPVLDGGHLVFHAYEAIVGKPPSDKALQVMMTTGLVLLLSLMVFALTNDLFCT